MRTLSQTPYLRAQNERLNRFIWYSLGVHVIAFILFTVRAYMAPHDQLQFENVIRVDIVGLPDKTTAPPEPPAPAPAPEKTAEKTKTPDKPEPHKLPPQVAKPETPKVNLDKTKQNTKSAALKRLEAIQRLKNAVKNEKAERAPIGSLVKGNEASGGASLKGIAKLNYENYQETAHAHIRKHWNLPHWMANANLSARVRIWVDSQGNILRKEVTRASSRPDFDERAMNALESSVPLPRPPAELAGILAVEGMEIEFVPN